MNLVNVIVGVGILGLVRSGIPLSSLSYLTCGLAQPFAFVQVGTIGAVLLMIAVGLGTVASFKLLLEAGDLVKAVSYPAIAKNTLGRFASRFRQC